MSWICPCGASNRDSSDSCRRCGYQLPQWHPPSQAILPLQQQTPPPVIIYQAPPSLGGQQTVAPPVVYQTPPSLGSQVQSVSATHVAGLSFAAKFGGCLGIFAAAVAVLFALGVIGRLGDYVSPTDANTSQRGSAAPLANIPPTVYALGQEFSIGYWSYRCNRFGWTPVLGSGFSMDQANAAFLVVDITAQNSDHTSSTLPPFYLMDTEGRKYDHSTKGSLRDGFFGPLEALNPGVSKRGYVAFDVPPEHQYVLLVSGGFESGRHAIVSLAMPKSNDQTQPEHASKAPASDPKCLSYAPALVTLTGALTEKSDEPETYWVLNLGQPICTTGGEHSSNVAERNVSSLQLLFTNDEVYQRYRFLLNTTVRVTGSLASGTTAQHHTQVVLQVVPPEGSAPVESLGGH